MYMPLPILAALGIVFLLLLILLLRRQSPDRDLIAPPRRPELRPTRSADTAAIADLPPEVETEVRALLAGGNKIEAIKLVREATHLGLADAKQLVERM